MALYVDKHRPKTFDSLDFHSELTGRLQRVANDFPHLLFYGPSGAGKKTRIMCLLRQVYGNGVEKMKVEHRRFTLPSKKVIELTTLASNHHIEMNPSDAGSSDRVVVQDIIKEMAQSVPIDSSVPFKVILLNEVDSLSKGAQHALRRTMEKYSSTCRLILCSNSTGRVIEPVRSRCLCIRVPAPSIEEISGVLQKTARKEMLQLPPALAQRIAVESGRNARRALLMLETLRVRQYPFDENAVIPVTDWEEFIVRIAKDMIEEQTPARLLVIRGKFYELLGHCVPPEVILKRLVAELLKKCDSSVQHQLVEAAALYDARIRSGSKPIFHLEAFAARFMQQYKTFLSTAFEFF